MTTPVQQSYAYEIAWPASIAMHGLALDNGQTENGWADAVPDDLADAGGVAVFDQIVANMDPARNPYYGPDGNTLRLPSPDLSESMAALAAFAAAIFPDWMARMTAAIPIDDVGAWDYHTADAISAHDSAVGDRAAAGKARAFGFACAASGLSGAKQLFELVPDAHAAAVKTDFAAKLGLNEKQQQSEMFLRRWDAGLRYMEVANRANFAGVNAALDYVKITVEAENDTAGINDAVNRDRLTWNLDQWDHFLEGVTALSGAAVQPRPMNKRERMLSAVATSGSMALQTGASTGNIALGLGFGAVSLAAQLWGMN